MKKLLLLIFTLFTFNGLYAQCNAVVLGNTTTVVSTNTSMDSAAAVVAFDSILICAGNTLTYNYVYEYKRFYVTSGATLVIKAIQQCEVNMEEGATLQIDTAGANFVPIMVSSIHFDSTNVNLVDTSQMAPGSTTWTHCPGNTFVYTLFNTGPCNPLSVVNNSLATMNINFENPVRDHIYLNNIVSDQIISAQVISLSGKVIRSFSNVSDQLNVADLPQAIYLLKLNGKNGETAIRKFLKE